MRNRNALKCILGVVVVASFLFVTWSTRAAREPFSKITGSTVNTKSASIPVPNHLMPRGKFGFYAGRATEKSEPPETATFADPKSEPDGTGVVSVASADGSCLAFTPANGGGPDQWEVVEGGNYTMTISNVTECTGDAITVFVQNTQTGNFCFNATKSATGTYTATFRMPNPACFTSPISYKCGADQACNNANTFNAQGPSGANSVHLRASIFDANCNKTGDDTNCSGGGTQGCTIQDAPADTDLGCNPTSIPGSEQTVSGTCNGTPITATYSSSETTDGCKHTRINTWSIVCGGETCSVSQTVTWTVDTTKPTITTKPNGGDLGCNPATLPTDDSVKAGVTATDDCTGSPTINVSHSDSITGCNTTRTFTITATDGCNNTSDPATVIYTWTIDTTKPTITTCPTGGDLGCNPANKPTCDSVKAGVVVNDNCSGTPTINCQQDDSDNGCTHTRKFTITATDACNNTSDPCVVTFTWTVDTTPPVITTPGNLTRNGGGACCVNVSYDASASDNCGVATFGCTPASGSCFPVGTTTVTCNATDNCGNPAQKSFNVTVLGQICVTKFYDANADGTQNNGEVGIAGWKITVSDGQVGYTGANGSVCFNVLAGTYTVTEILPPGNWVASRPTSCQVTVSSTNCNPSCTFGNYCSLTPGGLTIGFWSNKNGQKLETDSDFAGLTAFCLKNADGSDRDFTGSLSQNKADYNSWVLSANASNMANMLSAQLSGTYLNVQHGVTNPSIIVDGTRTVADEIAYANSLLCGSGPCTGYNGNSTAAGPCRTEQERVKNILDKINNGGSFVQPTPCPFTTPY